MMLAETEAIWHGRTMTVIGSVVIFLLTGGSLYVGLRPLKQLILRRENEYDLILRRALLMDISPRMVTLATAGVMVLLGFMGYAITFSVVGVLVGGALGFLLPHALIRYLRRRRLNRLENQLVGGIQTLASGVRAGLNLVQSIALVARDGPAPLREEFTHLLREYEYGLSLDEAMGNAADRIGSSDFRLLFAALHTHRERGGDLGQTLDRIADSIREIQRLENRVKTLTAQGRATARWLGVMPFVIMIILYFIDPDGVRRLFVQNFGKLILLAILLLTALGFLWIKKTVSIDI